MNEPARREETRSSERNRGENPSRAIAATAPLRRWIVRRSNFPFALPGTVLGVVEATDATDARMIAVRQFECATVVEPEHRVKPELERAVARAVKSADRRNRARGGRPRFARQAMKSLTNPHGDGE